MTTEAEAQTKKEFTQISKLFEKFISMKLKVKEANYFKKRHQYLTGMDFYTFIKENSDVVATEFNKIIPKSDLDPKAENLHQRVFRLLHDRGVLVRALREADDKKKYPKKLLAWEEDSEPESCGSCDEGDKSGKQKEKVLDFNKLDSTGFYILYTEASQSSLYFYLVLIIVGILAFCLLPVWPLELKIFIWWVSYILLIFMVGLIIIRWILYGFFLIFGKEFWLFPDLFNDNKGVFDSFVPLVSMNTKPIDYFSIFCRMVLAGMLVYTTYTFYNEPTLIDDAYLHVREIVTDMFSYVEDKIIAHHNGTQLSVVNNKDKLRDLLNDADL